MHPSGLVLRMPRGPRRIVEASAFNAGARPSHTRPRRMRCEPGISASMLSPVEPVRGLALRGSPRSERYRCQLRTLPGPGDGLLRDGTPRPREDGPDVSICFLPADELNCGLNRRRDGTVSQRPGPKGTEVRGFDVIQEIQTNVHPRATTIAVAARLPTGRLNPAVETTSARAE